MISFRRTVLPFLTVLAFTFGVDAAEPLLEPKSLVGTHVCKGSNEDGKGYEGTLTIRLKGKLLLFEWDIAGQKSFGTGLCEGMYVGIALEAGVVIYQVVPQAEGKTLLGLWALQGAEKASTEIILIGNPDITSFPPVEVQDFNGEYRMAQDVKGKYADAKVTMEISGGDMVKRALLGEGSRQAEAEGLALGEGLAFITPKGLIVLTREKDEKGQDILSGESLDGEGAVTAMSLVPIK